LVEAVELPAGFALTLDERKVDASDVYRRHFREQLAIRAAVEVSRVARGFEHRWYWPVSGGGLLGDRRPVNAMRQLRAPDQFNSSPNDRGRGSIIVLDAASAASREVRNGLLRLRRCLTHCDRVTVGVSTSLWQRLFGSAAGFDDRHPSDAWNVFQSNELEDVAERSALELDQLRPVGFFLFDLLGIGLAIDAGLRKLPITRRFAAMHLAVLRPSHRRA
jgi:hypothetical protein